MPLAAAATAAAAAAASNDDDEVEDDEEEDRGPRPPRPSTPPPIPISYESALLPSRAIDGAWNAQRKPLLRLGSKGVQRSHRNSLKELLAFHRVVRVKVSRASSTMDGVCVCVCGGGCGECWGRGDGWLATYGEAKDNWAFQQHHMLI